MRHSSRLNPNILLTETCNGSCNFCFAKSRMAKSQQKEMSLENFREVLEFLKKNGQKEVRLMGGEPTVHSQFKKIMEQALSLGFKVKIFTNGFFSHNLAHWMAKKGNALSYSVNLAAIATAEKKKKKNAENNLIILGKASRIFGSITVDSYKFKCRPIIKIVKRNNFQSVRIAIANNMMNNFEGSSIASDYKKVIEIAIYLAKKLKKIGIPEISFNCGFTHCMFSLGQKESLRDLNVRINGWGCAGKIGPFDIASDLSIFPCFPAENLKKNNLRDFNSLAPAKESMESLLKYSVRQLSSTTINDCKNCAYFEKNDCHGPCLGYTLNGEKYGANGNNSEF